MNRPDVLLLILPILLVLAWHWWPIHKYGWQSGLGGGEPRRDHPRRSPKAARLTPAPTSLLPGAFPPPSPSCYYAPVTLDEPSLGAATFDGWRTREKA